MRTLFLKDEEFHNFVNNMLQSTKVVAPVAKKNKFVFEEIKTPTCVRLDYDVTIIPPKKAIFPVKQNLVSFDGNKMESCINPVDQVLFGVHFYDVKAIDMLDSLFKADHADWNYLANREHTTIVASNIQTISPRGFWGSIDVKTKPKGHDAFLTKIKGGYVFEVLTQKGENLVKNGNFVAASPDQTKEAVQVNEAVMHECNEKLKYNSEEVAKKVRAEFKNQEIWNELSHDCFSCGTCNIVCPTCYCFDVQDTWNLDQTSGVRTRKWDGCLLEDFSKVSLGGGHTENFREERASRYRHRVMRKTTYLNDKLDGSPACVGCGRCSIGCVPDIADPVRIISRIMEK